MFKPFDEHHLIALGLISACGWLVARACSRWERKRRAWLGRVLALLLIGYAATVYVQKGIAGELSWRYALPLELCHWVMIAAVISLLHPSQLLSEVAYFWGTAGTLQATLTPDLYSGFPSWEFIFFFWSHGGILLAILFLFLGQDFRPRPGGVMRMMAAVNIYAVAVGAFDALTGCNYGYLCDKPSMPSLLDYLGPWPWYLVSLEFVALASFFLLDLPWRVAPRRRSARAPH
jgi:hypothetical integral membrane protein (TIGR02206 family)